MMLSERCQTWLDQFAGWAKPRSDMRAAMIFGSQARKEGSLADDWSDLDIAIFTSKPGLYTKGSDWMREIAPMWSGVIDPGETWNGAAAASGFSVYEGGLIVDTVILPTMRAQLAIACISLLKGYPGLWKQPDHPIIRFCSEFTGFFHRGAIVVFDKDGLTRRLETIAQSIPQYAPPPPSAKQFQKSADDFWVDPPRAAVNLRRGKLVGAMRPFTPMMRQLYRMTEWHARAKNGWDGGQQYPIKLIEQWADPCVVTALPEIYPRYDSDAMWRALLALMNLYRRLTVETAGLLGYEYNPTAADHISTWVDECKQDALE